MLTLNKGDKASLGSGKIQFGLSWTPGDSRNIDLDASCFCSSGSPSILETIYYGHKSNAYITHHGDDLTGHDAQTASDNEVITVDTSKIPSNVDYLVFTLNSFSNDDLRTIPRSGIRVYRGEVGNPDEVLATFDVVSEAGGAESAEKKGFFKNLFSSEEGAKKSMIVGIVKRSADDWEFVAVGDMYANSSLGSLEGPAMEACKAL